MNDVLCVLATLAVAVCQTSEPIDCSIFSPVTNPPSLPCVAVTNNGFPKDIATTSNHVQIFHYNTNTDWTKDPAQSQVLQSVADAVDHVMPTFATYADTFQANIVIVKQLSDNKAGLAESSQDGSSCFVQILYPANAQGVTYLPQVVAHELYHCVQSSNNPQIVGPPPPAGLTDEQKDAWPGWWVEASAEYFADEFYPAVAAQENSPIQDYYPTIQLYKYSQAYRASLFLQHWSNSGMKDTDINDWVSSHVLTGTLEDEATQLSEEATIINKFPTFASAFWSNTIKLSDGTTVSSGERSGLPVEEWVVNLPADGSVSTQIYNIDPFTINVFTAIIQPGQEIKITLSTTDTPHTVLQYRRATSPTWTTLYITGSLPLDCSGSEAATWEFIVTTTHASLDKSAGKVIFERSDSQSCNCDTSQNLPLDPCLAGSWVFDTAGLRTVLQNAIQSEGGTLTDLTITGDSTLEITLPPVSTSTITYSDLTIAMAFSVDGFDATSSVDIDGTVSAGIVMQTANSVFCWQNPKSQGTAVIGIDGVKDVEEIGLQYGQSGTIVEYTCDANTLTLTGSFGGMQVLQQVYKKAAA